MPLTQSHKDKMEQAINYHLKDEIDLENAVSGVPLGPNDLIKKALQFFQDQFDMISDESQLDTYIAGKEAQIAIDDVLLTHTSGLITNARDNSDLDDAIAALQAAKT